MSTTTPSLLGETISHLIRHGTLEEIIAQVDESVRTRESLDTCDFSLRLLLAVPLLARHRPRQLRLAIFCILLASGCDSRKKGADGFTLDWELHALQEDVRTFAGSYLAEARSCRDRDEPYLMPADVQDWIQHEVEKCQRRQVDAHERAERERKSIFAGLERELVELDRSMRPRPAKRAKLEPEAEELVDYEELEASERDLPSLNGTNIETDRTESAQSPAAEPKDAELPAPVPRPISPPPVQAPPPESSRLEATSDASASPQPPTEPPPPLPTSPPPSKTTSSPAKEPQPDHPLFNTDATHQPAPPPLTQDSTLLKVPPIPPKSETSLSVAPNSLPAKPVAGQKGFSQQRLQQNVQLPPRPSVPSPPPDDLIRLVRAALPPRPSPPSRSLSTDTASGLPHRRSEAVEPNTLPAQVLSASTESAAPSPHDRRETPAALINAGESCRT